MKKVNTMKNMMTISEVPKDDGFRRGPGMRKDMYSGYNPNHPLYQRRVMEPFRDASGARLNQLVAQLIGGQELEIRNDYLVAVNPAEKLAKANITTTTTAAYNALFDGVATIQIAQQQNVFGAIPKEGYPREGYRTVSAAAYSSGVGIAEASAIGTAAVPTYQEITVGLKEVEAVTDLSMRMKVIESQNDNLQYDENTQVVYSNFLTALDYDLLQDMGTTANLNVESVDRVCGSSGENTAIGYDANDEDLYSIDRSTYTWFDANSDYATTDRPINTKLIDALMKDQIDRWGQSLENKMYITNTDTWVNWSALESPKMRYEGDMFKNTMEGVQPVPGLGGGYRLNTYDAFPVILDTQVQQDGAGRLYLLDGNTTKICMGMPIKLYQSDNPFEVGHLLRACWYGAMELRCTLPSASGKLRDLLA